MIENNAVYVFVPNTGENDTGGKGGKVEIGGRGGSVGNGGNGEKIKLDSRVVLRIA